MPYVRLMFMYSKAEIDQQKQIVCSAHRMPVHVEPDLLCCSCRLLICVFVHFNQYTSSRESYFPSCMHFVCAAATSPTIYGTKCAKKIENATYATLIDLKPELYWNRRKNATRFVHYQQIGCARIKLNWTIDVLWLATVCTNAMTLHRHNYWNASARLCSTSIDNNEKNQFHRKKKNDSIWQTKSIGLTTYI